MGVMLQIGEESWVDPELIVAVYYDATNNCPLVLLEGGIRMAADAYPPAVVEAPEGGTMADQAGCVAALISAVQVGFINSR